MAQQTSVEWLVKNLPEDYILALPYELVEQAKEMFQQQIETAYNKGTINGIDYPESKLTLTGEQYYNQTYGK